MRLIDADKLDYTCNADECSRLAGCIHCQYSIITEDEIESAQTVEAIPKSNYEARLKADMVAMLTDIQLEIRKYHEIGCDEDCNNCRMVGCVEPVNVIKDLDIIQQEIDALKGES